MYSEIKKAARGAMLKLIEAEREGEQIDRSLLKNVLGIYQEVGGGSGTCGGAAGKAGRLPLASCHAAASARMLPPLPAALALILASASPSTMPRGQQRAARQQPDRKPGSRPPICQPSHGAPFPGHSPLPWGFRVQKP